MFDEDIRSRRNRKGDGKTWLFLLFLLGGSIFLTFLFKYFFETEPVNAEPEVIKLSDDQYEKWKAVCETMSEYGPEESEFVMLSEGFMGYCLRERKKIEEFCFKNSISYPLFMRFSSNLIEARGYFKSLENLRAPERSIFPLDLLPGDYSGTVPENAPYRLEEKDYRHLDPIRIHNLKFYEEKKEEIEETWSYLEYPGEEKK